MAQKKSAGSKKSGKPSGSRKTQKSNPKKDPAPFMLDVLCAIALMLALFTGMGIHSYQAGEETVEFFGLFGGLMVQGLMALFGKAAIAVPAFLVVWGIHLVALKRLWSARMSGVLLLMASWALYCSLERIPRGLTPWEAAGYGMGGGYVGAVLAILGVKLVGQIGSKIIQVVLIVAGVALIVQRSALSIGKALWQWLKKGAGALGKVIYYEEKTEPEKETPVIPVEPIPSLPVAESRKKRKTREPEPIPADEWRPLIVGLDDVPNRAGEWNVQNPEEEPQIPLLSDWNVPEQPPVEPAAAMLQPFLADAEESGESSGLNLTDMEIENQNPEESLQPPPYVKPALTLLNHDLKNKNIDRDTIRENSYALEKTLAEFGVKVKVEEVVSGPAVTRYEMSLAPGTKVSKIVGLSDDLQLRLAASGIRIEAPIPGKSAVGIELPNKDVRGVGLYEILASENFAHMNSPLAFALGEDITGRAVCARLKDMPHLLIAGSTGSGKSVCINGIIMSFLFNAHPDELKMVLIDPKMVELAVYNGLPHLMTPVVTDPKKASQILHWMTTEMEKRYKKFAAAGVRDITRYREVTGEAMPYIVIVIDELADLMMVAPGEVEDSICRLAQMARAAGMHLIVATQRPSVDVVTGIIKANIPSRIAFAVSSQMDSRTILDMGGAEKLLGKGDMLFFPVGMNKPQRIQGAFVSDEEIEKTVSFITQQTQNEVQYNEELENLPDIRTEKAGGGRSADAEEELLMEAVRVVIEAKKASTLLLQRRLHIGFVRASDLMELMEKRGIISAADGKNARKVLVNEDFLRQLQERNQ